MAVLVQGAGQTWPGGKFRREGGGHVGARLPLAMAAGLVTSQAIALSSLRLIGHLPRRYLRRPHLSCVLPQLDCDQDIAWPS